MPIDPNPLVWADYDPKTGIGDPSTPSSAASLNRITAEVASEVEERIARARVATLAADSVTYAPFWQPLMAYALGARVVNPTGDLVTAKAAFTSGAAYVSTNWNLSTAYAPAGSAGTTDATVAPIITQPLTKAALDGAYAPLGDPTWLAVALNSGITNTSGFPTFAYRLENNGTQIHFRGTRLTIASLAVTAGGDYNLASAGNVLPVAARPQGLRYATVSFYTSGTPLLARLTYDNLGAIGFRPGSAGTATLIEFPDVIWQL